MLKSFLSEVKDNRRKQGKRYQLDQVLMLAILAILSSADSYRKIHTFIEEHYERLNKEFNLNWKRIPAYTTIREIIQGVSSTGLEESFRKYSSTIAGKIDKKSLVSFDGKTLRGSFDNLKDKKAAQILSVFLEEKRIILAHHDIDEKTNEIPTAQALMKELGIKNCVFTFDAMNCQKKL